MKKEARDWLIGVLEKCKRANINGLVIDNDTIRGSDNDRMLILYSEHDHEFDFSIMGINRVSELYDRIKSVGDKYELEVTDVDASKNFAKMLTIKNKKAKITYRCANPMVVNAPKKMSNLDMAFRLVLDATSYDKIRTAQVAMGTADTKKVSFLHNNSGTGFEVQDMLGDTYIHFFENDAEVLDDGGTEFFYSYNIKTLLLLLKLGDNLKCEISRMGLMRITAGELSFYLIPIKE